MQSPNAFERIALLAIVAAVLTSTKSAGADDKKQCSDAYDQTQIQRQQKKLSAAREQALICKRESCAAFVRKDCETWFREIEAAMPSVVLDVKDSSGAPATAVKVSLDGAPWLDSVDKTPHPLDPGKHVLRFELEGAAPIDETVRLEDGAKDQPVSVSFIRHAAAPTPMVAAPPATTRPIGPYVVGAVGAAGLVVGVLFGALTLSKKSVVDDNHCKQVGASWQCDATGRAATDAGKTFGPISTVGFVVGGVGLGAAAVWFITSKPKSSGSGAEVGLATSIDASGGSLHFDGRF